MSSAAGHTSERQLRQEKERLNTGGRARLTAQVEYPFGCNHRGRCRYHQRRSRRRAPGGRLYGKHRYARHRHGKFDSRAKRCEGLCRMSSVRDGDPVKCRCHAAGWGSAQHRCREIHGFTIERNLSGRPVRNRRHTQARTFRDGGSSRSALTPINQRTGAVRSR